MGLPCSVIRIDRLTAKQGLGMDYNDFGIADNFVDPKSRWRTANDTTIYAFVDIDLTEEPIAIEIPPGAIVGLLNDFWQRSVTDVACLGLTRGREARSCSCHRATTARFLLRHYVLRAAMHNHDLLIRGIIVDDNVPDAVERIRKTRLPGSDARSQATSSSRSRAR